MWYADGSGKRGLPVASAARPAVTVASSVQPRLPPSALRARDPVVGRRRWLAIICLPFAMQNPETWAGPVPPRPRARRGPPADARRAGFRQLQPSRRRIFQTCPMWYRIPVAIAITSATRSSVQSSVCQPYAAGPLSLAQASNPFLLPGLAPDRGALPRYPQLARDFGRAHTLGEQPGGSQPTLLQGAAISAPRPARTLAGT